MVDRLKLTFYFPYVANYSETGVDFSSVRVGRGSSRPYPPTQDLRHEADVGNQLLGTRGVPDGCFTPAWL